MGQAKVPPMATVRGQVEDVGLGGAGQGQYDSISITPGLTHSQLGLMGINNDSWLQQGGKLPLLYP